MLRKLTTNKSIEKDVLEKNEMLEAKAGSLLACFSKLFTVAAECGKSVAMAHLAKR